VADGDKMQNAAEKEPTACELAALKEEVIEGREHAQILRAILNHQPVVAGRIDAQGVVTTAMGSLIADYGLEAAQLVGLNVFTLCPDSADHIRCALAGGSVDFPWTGLVMGVERRLHKHLCFDKERGEGAVFFARDMTETKQTERALAESRQQFQLLLERSLDAILLIDDDGVCIEANQVACEVLGCERKQVVRRRATEFAGREFKPLEADALAKSYFQSARRYHVSSFLWPDGQTRLVEYSVYRASPHFHLCILRDITERRRLEREILEVSDQEQHRFSQDLHDGLGQHLAGVGYMSEALAAQLSACAAPQAKAAAQIADLIAQAGAQARAIARSLSPVELDARHLLDALGLLAANAREIYGIDCRLETQGGTPRLTNTSAMHLYRLAQEAVNNAQRHSRASAIHIRLVCRDGQVVLSVQDNGEAIPQAADPHPRRGLGLHMMNYRATLLGGTLTVHPVEQGGTLITCTLQANALERVGPQPGEAVDFLPPV
jgi:PAS domain S-box-containing protein